MYDQPRHVWTNNQDPAFEKVDSVINWINHYPVDNVIGLCITYPRDSDLSSAYRFQQLGKWRYWHMFAFGSRANTGFARHFDP